MTATSVAFHRRLRRRSGERRRGRRVRRRRLQRDHPRPRLDLVRRPVRALTGSWPHGVVPQRSTVVSSINLARSGHQRWRKLPRVFRDTTDPKTNITTHDADSPLRRQHTPPARISPPLHPAPQRPGRRFLHGRLGRPRRPSPLDRRGLHRAHGPGRRGGLRQALRRLHAERELPLRPLDPPHHGGGPDHAGRHGRHDQGGAAPDLPPGRGRRAPSVHNTGSTDIIACWPRPTSSPTSPTSTCSATARAITQEHHLQIEGFSISATLPCTPVRVADATATARGSDPARCWTSRSPGVGSTTSQGGLAVVYANSRPHVLGLDRFSATFTAACAATTKVTGTVQPALDVAALLATSGAPAQPLL